MSTMRMNMMVSQKPFYRKAFFFVTFFTVTFILLPSHNFQYYLSQGDHGRDLYAFAATLDGQRPYIDYWWVYGPLMPYFYAFLFYLFGMTIHTIIIGKLILLLIAALFFYLALSKATAPEWGLIGTLFFVLFQPDFFFTYNHIGGLTALLAVFYFLISYLYNQEDKYLNGILISAFVLCLIKINFGVVALLASLISVCLINAIIRHPISEQGRAFYLRALIFIPLIVTAIYVLFLKDLPSYAIRQCLPYLSDDQPHRVTMQAALQTYWSMKRPQWTGGQVNVALFIIFLILFFYVIDLLFSKKMPLIFKYETIMVSFITIIFFIGSMNEFLLSGVHYRSFWAEPFLFFIVFFIAGQALQYVNIFLRYIFYIAVLIFFYTQLNFQLTSTMQAKSKTQWLRHPRAQIFVKNDVGWIDTVDRTVSYLDKNMTSDESLFVLPYDALYYYLLDKSSPTRQLIFFDHIKIPPEQDRLITRTIAEKKVDWVILSSRMKTNERGMGEFGRTYTPQLAKYIYHNYEQVQEFGDWKNEPGWAWNHGTKILKRINPL